MAAELCRRSGGVCSRGPGGRLGCVSGGACSRGLAALRNADDLAAQLDLESIYVLTQLCAHAIWLHNWKNSLFEFSLTSEEHFLVSVWRIFPEVLCPSR